MQTAKVHRRQRLAGENMKMAASRRLMAASEKWPKRNEEKYEKLKIIRQQAS